LDSPARGPSCPIHDERAAKPDATPDHPAFFIGMYLKPLDTLLRLVYPPLCPGCGWRPVPPGQLACVECLSQWPETNFHQLADNPFTRHFVGRISIETGAAFLFFAHGGVTRNVLHRIKYHHRPDLAHRLGRWYGRMLSAVPHWQGIEVVVPVPLTWRRERERGYNQSERFGSGVAESLRCRCEGDVLARTAFKRSLTGLGRFDRIRAISAAFRLNQPSRVRGRHVLLVDDVLTTGATLEACAIALLAAGPASLRLATIATGEL